MPYDYYCPSLPKGTMDKMICRKCEMYFATQVAKRTHACKTPGELEFDESTNSEPEEMSLPEIENASMPVIGNLAAWFEK